MGNKELYSLIQLGNSLSLSIPLKFPNEIISPENENDYTKIWLSSTQKSKTVVFI